MKWIKNYLKKKIVKWLYDTNALEIHTHKKIMSYGVIATIRLFGTPIKTIDWSKVELDDLWRC